MSLIRRHYLLLAAIVAAALLLRLVQIDREALWTDEALTLLIRHWPVEDLFFWSHDPSPGLYYALTKIFVPDGASAALARGPSVFFGTAAVLAIYAVGRLAFDRRSGLIAAAMLAVSPVAVDYSQEARAYSLLMLLVLVSAGALLWWVRGLRHGRANYAALVVFALATVLALYTHFTSVFWILPAVVGGREITDRLADSAARRRYVAACLAMALAALPEVVRITFRLFPRSGFGGLGFVPDASFLEFLTIAGDTVFPATLWDGQSTTRWISAAFFGLVIAYAAGRLAIGWAQVRSWGLENPAAPVTVGALALLPLSVWLFSYAVSPIFMARSVLLAIPGTILLLVLLGKLDRISYWLPFVAGSAAALLINGTVREKEDWRSVAARLRSEMRAGDGIVICPDWRGPALLHAAPALLNRPVYLLQGTNLIRFQADRGEWERQLHRLLTSWVGGSAVLEPSEPGTLARGFPARLWIVESECRQPRSRLLRTWLGSGFETGFNGSSNHPGISLSLFERAPEEESASD